jgi:hypothetical protein
MICVSCKPFGYVSENSLEGEEDRAPLLHVFLNVSTSICARYFDIVLTATTHQRA